MRERQQESICVSLCGEVEGGGAGSSAVLCSAVVQALCCHLPFFFFLGKPCPAAKAKQTAALATTEQRQAEAAERFKLRVSKGTKS